MMKTKSDALRITKLSAQKRDPSRVNIFLDGKYSFSLSADEVILRQLHKDQILSQQEVGELSSLSGSEKVFAKVISFISYRPRSVKEVKDRLYTYLGPDEEEQKKALIARLEKLGYLDDRQFAKWFVSSRVQNRPRSLRHLSAELYAKGITKEIITEALSEGADETSAIRQLIKKKKGMDRDKLTAFLARRGFSWEIIKDEISGEYDPVSLSDKE